MPRPKKVSIESIELKEVKEVKEATKAKEVKTVNKKVEGVSKEAYKGASKVDKNAITKTYPKIKREEPKPNTISRMELSQEVAKAVGAMMEITNKDCEAIVTEILDSMIDSLQSGEKIEIRGFGSFRLRSRRARNGRNPKTGESVKVPGKTVVYFKMGSELKEFLKQQKVE